MTDLIKEVEDMATVGLGLRAKLIAGLGAIIILLVIGLWLASHFEAKGRTIERADWLAKQVKEQQADAALVNKHEAGMRALKAHQQQTEREISEKHEAELAQLRRERDADRRRADAAGGLRIAAPACPASGAVAGTEAAGAERRDEPASAATVRLPESIENDLWSAADAADEVSAQLRACQRWVLANGFYGTATVEKPQLLGRIVAGKNNDAGAEK